jgi:2-polyprenyl-6-hydroxyphenyl methylase/3-demethylubiquinone-9 3-methyltransferase
MARRLPLESLATPAPPADAFRFGRNWQRYVDSYLNPERERIAAESLADLLEESLADSTFLDIGAGSGLFSLCAHKAGALRVVSVDIDPDAVETCNRLRASIGYPDNWVIIHGSILDAELLNRIEPADIVYSWGVLHHTGDMYAAIANAAQLVKPGGLFCIAVYNRVVGRFMDSQRWWRIKRFYNHAARPLQRIMEWVYRAYWAAAQIRKRKNPLRVAREYRHSRGMALDTDLVDWLGGYPYEFATAEEIVAFCEAHCHMRIVKLAPVSPLATGNNQFVFRRL